MYEVIRNGARRTFRTFRAAAGDFRGRILNYRQPSRYPIVVMYHSISERATRDWGPWQYAVTPETFECQLSHIEKEYTVLSVDRLVKWLIGNKSIPRDSIVLTFDDAYRDFQTEVLPLLESYGLPATVYVPTALLGDRSQALFEHRLGTTLAEQKELNVTMEEFSINTSLRTREEVIDCYERIRSNLKFSPPGRRERFFEAVKTEPKPEDTILGLEELQSLYQHSLVTVGAHGHEHVPFAALSAEEQKINAKTCRDRLAEALGTPPRHFSFPYGSFERSAVRAVKDAGFESAVTTRARSVSARDWGRPYTIPRIDAATERIDRNMELASAE